MAQETQPVTGVVIILLALAFGALLAYGLQRLSGVEPKRCKTTRHVDSRKVVEALTTVLPQSAESEDESERLLARAGVRMAPSALWATRIISVVIGIVLGLALAILGGSGAVALVAGTILGGVLGAMLPEV